MIRKSGFIVLCQKGFQASGKINCFCVDIDNGLCLGSVFSVEFKNGNIQRLLVIWLSRFCCINIKQSVSLSIIITVIERDRNVQVLYNE